VLLLVSRPTVELLDSLLEDELLLRLLRLVLLLVSKACVELLLKLVLLLVSRATVLLLLSLLVLCVLLVDVVLDNI